MTIIWCLYLEYFKSIIFLLWDTPNMRKNTSNALRSPLCHKSKVYYRSILTRFIKQIQYQNVKLWYYSRIIEIIYPCLKEAQIYYGGNVNEYTVLFTKLNT